jgi:hypothetical protein
MNPNLERLARETGADVGPDERLKEKAGMVFVDELGFWVSKNITYCDHSYLSCKTIAEELGAKILTPAEWWIFYDKCKSLIQPGMHEWLDAIVLQGEHLVVAPDEIDPENYLLYKGGTQFHVPHLRGNGRFDREDIDASYGMPAKLTVSGLYEYVVDNILIAAGLYTSNTLGARKIKQARMSNSGSKIGVRLCVEAPK